MFHNPKSQHQNIWFNFLKYALELRNRQPHQIVRQKLSRQLWKHCFGDEFPLPETTMVATTEQACL